MPEPPLNPLMPSLISIPADYGKTVPSRGRSTSPIRPAASVEKLRRPPSRTFIPLAIPVDIIDFPKIIHSRIGLFIDISSTVLMGGATAEGAIHLTIDGGHRKAKASTKLPPISIDRICVSLVGIERSGARQHMFRCLVTDLIDEAHPPPAEMARRDQPVSDQLWEVMPSSTILPFRLDLPVLLGPPPYKSRKNNIMYLISVLAEAKIDGKRNYVRQSEEVTVLTVHDPEKALLNLPNPLVVTEEVQTSHRNGVETVELVAGVHRQTWISGYPLFVDVRIGNRGSKVVKKVELQLERSTFVYAHAAPSDEQGLSDTLRLPDRCEKEVILKVDCPSWQVQPQSRDLKTCSLPIPSGLVSVDAGISRLEYLLHSSDFFISKHLMVQLPITIIHPNSIDIPPNSLAQVAATIEHKHRNRNLNTASVPYNYRPGQAFLAARRQSFEQASRDTIPQDEMSSIADALSSLERPPAERPRRRASTTVIKPESDYARLPYRNSRFLEGTNGFRDPPPSPTRPPPSRPSIINYHSPVQRPEIPQRRTHRASTEEHSSRQPLLDHQTTATRHRRTKTLEDRYYRGPRLQRSTSGLKFSSSDDDGDMVYEGFEDLGSDARTRLKRKGVTESQRLLRWEV
ncbi:MAG: hypothetical protein Q9223_004047 [Gallowayella weberi]